MREARKNTGIEDNPGEKRDAARSSQEKIVALKIMAEELTKDGVNNEDVVKLLKGLDTDVTWITEEVKEWAKKIVLSLLQEIWKKEADGKTDISLEKTIERTTRKTAVEKYSAIADKNDGTLFWDTKVTMLDDRAIQGLITKLGLTPEEIQTALSSENNRAKIIANNGGKLIEDSGDWKVAERATEEFREREAAKAKAQAELLEKSKTAGMEDLNALDRASEKSAAEKVEVERIAKAEANGQNDRNALDKVSEASEAERVAKEKLLAAQKNLAEKLISANLRNSKDVAEIQKLINIALTPEQLKQVTKLGKLEEDGIAWVETKRSIQTALNILNPDNIIPVDGKFGEKTNIAIAKIKDIVSSTTQVVFHKAPNGKLTGTV